MVASSSCSAACFNQFGSSSAFRSPLRPGRGGAALGVLNISAGCVRFAATSFSSREGTGEGVGDRVGDGVSDAERDAERDAATVSTVTSIARRSMISCSWTVPSLSRPFVSKMLPTSSGSSEVRTALKASDECIGMRSKHKNETSYSTGVLSTVSIPKHAVTGCTGKISSFSHRGQRSRRTVFMPVVYLGYSFFSRSSPHHLIRTSVLFCEGSSRSLTLTGRSTWMSRIVS